MTLIKLTTQEIYLAANAGLVRRLSAIKRGGNDRYKDGDLTAWQGDIDGCIGEFAVAKYLDVFWTGQERINAPDVGDVEVRSTRHKNGSLIVNDNDNENAIMVLAIVSDKSVFIPGCIMVKEGKSVGEYRNVRKPGYWVDQKHLSPLRPRPSYSPTNA